MVSDPKESAQRCRSKQSWKGSFVTEKNRQVGVIGLGLMGTAIAERVLEHGYRACIWNRTRDKAAAFLARA